MKVPGLTLEEFQVSVRIGKSEHGKLQHNFFRFEIKQIRFEVHQRALERQPSEYMNEEKNNGENWFPKISISSSRGQT